MIHCDAVSMGCSGPRRGVDGGGMCGRPSWLYSTPQT